MISGRERNDNYNYLNRLLMRCCKWKDNNDNYDMRDVYVYDRSIRNVNVSFENRKSSGNVWYTISQDSIDEIYHIIQEDKEIELLKWNDYDYDSWMTISFYKYTEGIKVNNLRALIDISANTGSLK